MDQSKGARLPLSAIRKALFEQAQWSERVRKLYNIEAVLSGSDLEKEIARLFGQRVCDPKSQCLSQNEVFEAVTKALGSNMRSWARVYNNLTEISHLLFSYSVTEVSKIEGEDFEKLAEQLYGLFGGQTGRRDATNILRNAQLLSQTPDFYAYLLNVRAFIHDSIEDASASELTAGTALFIGSSGLNKKAKIKQTLHQTKLHGMGPVLASEFLRNMGWSGFKPDRHIIRLLSKWYNESEREAIIGNRLEKFEATFGTLRKDDECFLRFSILGEMLTPQGEEVNAADQLVWLYGSLLRKKAFDVPFCDELYPSGIE